jgi:hypothetical protein
MHYSKNGIWNLADVDEESIKPKAPTGAWGVEMEAIRYLVSHGYPSCRRRMCANWLR